MVIGDWWHMYPGFLQKLNKAMTKLKRKLGCKKCHVLIYGRPIVTETDHKPLISIAKKGLLDTPLRLRLFFQLQLYDLTTIHKPRKELVIADTLSRAFDKSVVERGGVRHKACQTDTKEWSSLRKDVK